MEEKKKEEDGMIMVKSSIFCSPPLLHGVDVEVGAQGKSQRQREGHAFLPDFFFSFLLLLVLYISLA